MSGYPDTMDSVGVVIIAPTAPAVGVDGDLWLDLTTDTLNVSNGGQWVPVGGSGPAEVSVGAATPSGSESLWYQTTTGNLMALSGGAWVAVSPPEVAIDSAAPTGDETIWYDPITGVLRADDGAGGWNVIAPPEVSVSAITPTSGEYVWYDTTTGTLRVRTAPATWTPIGDDAIISDPPVGVSQSITAIGSTDVPLTLEAASNLAGTAPIALLADGVVQVKDLDRYTAATVGPVMQVYADADGSLFAIPLPPTVIIAQADQAAGSTAEVIVFSAGDFEIDWGDGATTTTASGQAASHQYTTDYNGDIRIIADDVTSIQVRNSNATNITFPAANLPDSLQSVDFLKSGSGLSGDVKDLPRGMINISSDQGDSALTGGLGNLPLGLRVFNIGRNTQSTVTGSANQLPAMLTIFKIDNTGGSISGVWADVPRAMVNFNTQGTSSDVSGPATDLPRVLVNLTIDSSSVAVTGDWADMPPLIQTLNVKAAGFAVTGDMADIPRTVTILLGQGSTLGISGAAADMPSGMANFDIPGTTATFTGDWADLPDTLFRFNITGTQAAITGNSSGFPSRFENVSVQGTPSRVSYDGSIGIDTSHRGVVFNFNDINLDAATVDGLLNELQNMASWNGAKLINLAGASNAGRTTASDAAVAALQAAGATVTTN